MVQNVYSKMRPTSCNNIHHEVTDLVNHRMVKNTKTWIFRERNITLPWKKIINLYLRWHILRSYGFVTEVTFTIQQILRSHKLHVHFLSRPPNIIEATFTFPEFVPDIYEICTLFIPKISLFNLFAIEMHLILECCDQTV